MITDCGYSKKYKKLARDRIEQLKEINQQEIFIQKQKIRVLSKQTNDIRKKLEERKKSSEEKEEERKQRILKSRKLKQQAATEKFQRCAEKPPNKEKSRKNVAKNGLKDGSYNVRGHVIEIRNGVRINSRKEKNKDSDDSCKMSPTLQNNLYNGGSYLSSHLNTLLNENIFDKQNSIINNSNNNNNNTIIPESFLNTIPDAHTMTNNPVNSINTTNNKTIKNQLSMSPAHSICSNDSLNTASGEESELQSSLKGQSIKACLPDTIHRKVTFADSIEFNDGIIRPLQKKPLYKRMQQNIDMQQNRISVDNNNKVNLTTEELLDKMRQESLLPKYPQNGDYTYPDSIVISQQENNVAVVTSQQNNIAVVAPLAPTFNNGKNNTDDLNDIPKPPSISVDSLLSMNPKDSLDFGSNSMKINNSSTKMLDSLVDVPITESYNKNIPINSFETMNKVTSEANELLYHSEIFPSQTSILAYPVSNPSQTSILAYPVSNPSNTEIHNKENIEDFNNNTNMYKISTAQFNSTTKIDSDRETGQHTIGSQGSLVNCQPYSVRSEPYSSQFNLQSRSVMSQQNMFQTEANTQSSTIICRPNTVMSQPNFVASEANMFQTVPSNNDSQLKIITPQFNTADPYSDNTADPYSDNVILQPYQIKNNVQLNMFNTQQDHSSTSYQQSTPYNVPSNSYVMHPIPYQPLNTYNYLHYKPPRYVNTTLNRANPGVDMYHQNIDRSPNRSNNGIDHYHQNLSCNQFNHHVDCYQQNLHTSYINTIPTQSNQIVDSCREIIKGCVDTTPNINIEGINNKETKSKTACIPQDGSKVKEQQCFSKKIPTVHNNKISDKLDNNVNTNDRIYNDIAQSLADLTFESTLKTLNENKASQKDLKYRPGNLPKGDILNNMENILPQQLHISDKEHNKISDAVKEGTSIPIRIHANPIRRGRVIISADSKRRKPVGNLTPHPPPPKSKSEHQNVIVLREKTRTNQKPTNKKPHHNKSILNRPNGQVADNSFHYKMSGQTDLNKVVKSNNNIIQDNTNNIQLTHQQQHKRNTHSSNSHINTHKASAIRLDKTPTDDEINSLWENVRECLQSDSAEQAHSDSMCIVDKYPHKKYERTFSGSLINRRSNQQLYNPAESLRTYSAIKKCGSHDMLYRQNSNESLNSVNSFTKRQALLPQRASEIMAAPVLSNKSNRCMNGNNGLKKPPVDRYKDVTSSMASFLALEELCAQQSLTPRQAEAVFEASKHLQRIQSGSSKNAGMSALSIEERKVMESLERINQRLDDQDRMKVDLVQNKAPGISTVRKNRLMYDG